VLSSRTDEIAKVKALDLGADDYVSKPFGINELLARIRAALRHRLQQEGERPAFRCGALAVDLVRRLVTLSGAEVKLTPREYDLLRLFVAHAGKVLAHRFILREVWGGEGEIQYLRIYIRSLRQKIETNPDQPRCILTEQGVGYRMRAPTDGFIGSHCRFIWILYVGSRIYSALRVILGCALSIANNDARLS
jgi:two-component system, OmpR family, KDP operon response regulator KdpE